MAVPLTPIRKPAHPPGWFKGMTLIEKLPRWVWSEASSSTSVNPRIWSKPTGKCIGLIWFSKARLSLAPHPFGAMTRM